MVRHVVRKEWEQASGSANIISEDSVGANPTKPSWDASSATIAPLHTAGHNGTYLVNRYGLSAHVAM